MRVGSMMRGMRVGAWEGRGERYRLSGYDSSHSSSWCAVLRSCSWPKRTFLDAS